ncbi:MAG: HD domain-containing protein [Acidimicrobiia bacterium]|nr:HD domain-containing protein [Acidimicrobiia bacterium]
MTVEKPLSNPLAGGAQAAGDTQARFLRTGDAEQVLEQRSRWVDSVVTAAYEAHLAPVFSTGMAVLAVGGYGRRELFPHSDIDVLLLVAPGDPTGVAKEALSRFLQSIWDSELRLSHSVRTVKECCELHEQNVELNISLLDQRFLTGDEALHRELLARTPKFLGANRLQLARHLCKLTRQRHAKFHDTIHHLEPNIKEAPGGLRDLQLLHWLRCLEMTSSSEDAQMEQPRRFLHSMRCYLHYRSGRDNNLLNFEAQEAITEQSFLPFEDPSHSMREYYRHARAVHRAALRDLESVESRHSSLLAGFRDWRTRLSNSDFTVSRERLLFKSPQLLAQDPKLCLRLAAFLGRHRVQLHADSERRIQEHLPQLREFFAGPEPLWPDLRQILDLPHASFALRALHDTGLLAAIIPSWAQIECYVVRDFHHRYTVDEHTLITIENLELLPASKDDPARGRFAHLLSEIESSALVKLALLYHDIGKGDESEDHSLASRRLAAAESEKLGISAQDRQTLEFLIENHLILSGAMTGRDLDDPDTATWLAHKITTLERLKLLTLMTYCDIGAVNPTALSPWRMEQLWRVYLITYRELTRELKDEMITPSDAAPELRRFLTGFPTRYLRIHSTQEIERHFLLDQGRAADGAVVDITRQNGVYQLTVLANDRHFLFASLAGAVASFGMNILKAEAFANTSGTVLDTFVFEDPQRTLDLNPQELDRMRHTIERVVLGRTDVKKLLGKRPRLMPPSKGGRITGRITFDNEVSTTATLVEVVAEDRPGLLYDLTAVFSEAGCNIEVVLVDTEAHRALDVFYVTQQGSKLPEPLLESLRAPLLAACNG